MTVTARFAAAHQLRLPGGALEPLHEHAWHVQVTYEGAKLNDGGLLTDFVSARERLLEVVATLDGQNLNLAAALGNRNPSAEVVALYIAEQLGNRPALGARLHCVAVEEEPGCWARYYPGSA